jgi:hypothetical protein
MRHAANFAAEAHDGVVYEKDFGEKTLEEFQRMELFNPDNSWIPVPEEK